MQYLLLIYNNERNVVQLDEAIGLAARVPGARTGGVEVRPIRPMPST